jgi:hypothetical protein
LEFYKKIFCEEFEAYLINFLEYNEEEKKEKIKELIKELKNKDEFWFYHKLAELNALMFSFKIKVENYDLPYYFDWFIENLNKFNIFC